MSLDIFLMTLMMDEAGNQRRFDRSVVEEAFRSIAVHAETDEWELKTPKGDLCFAVVSVPVEQKITGISINRPPDMPTFWDAMYEVLRRTQTVVVWPGFDPAYCVAHSNYAQFVPADYMETFGAPVLASCGADISIAVEASVGSGRRS